MAQQQKIGYEVNGEIVTTLKQVAEKLGVDRVTSKDIQEGGKYADQVNLVDLSDEEEDNVVEVVAEDTDEDDTEEVNKNEIYSTVDEDDIDLTPEEVKASMPDFETLDELKEFIKDLDTPTLEYLAKGLRLEWTPTYHANIHRMRIAMAMHRYFFPELFKPKETKKKKAKYGDYSTEQLFKMAEEHGITFKKSGNEPIDRMRVIMELKKAGHLPE
jgi:hypothetical protein